MRFIKTSQNLNLKLLKTRNSEMAALKLLKSIPGARLYQDVGSKVKCILLENVRASYCFAGTPGEDENEDGTKSKSWRVTAMLPKSTHAEAKALVKELIVELQTTNDVKVPSTEWFLADGDGEKYQDEKNKAMNGHWLVSVKDARIRPRARNERGEIIDDIDVIDSTFYSGCWMNLMIRPWYFNGVAKGKAKKYPKRILAGFVSLQKHHNDTPFGMGRIDDEDVYGDVSGGNGMDDDAPTTSKASAVDDL